MKEFDSRRAIGGIELQTALHERTGPSNVPVRHSAAGVADTHVERTPVSLFEAFPISWYVQISGHPRYTHPRTSYHFPQSSLDYWRKGQAQLRGSAGP
jgi:hypothetical protein